MGEKSSQDLRTGGGLRAVGKRPFIIASLIVFLLAFGVRLLSLQDTRQEVGKIQTVVAGDYKRVASLLREGGAASFFDSSSPLGDPNTLGHPPGYSILLAVIYGTAGERDGVTQFIQITIDALCAVLIFAIVAELLSAGAGFIAGLLAALSPQFAWNSVLLLPDSLSVFPVLLAVLLLALAVRRPRLTTIFAVGALTGLSCWLRANALLLAPFLALACFLLFERGRRLSCAATLLAGAVLVIAPLTIRNAVVFRHFIPLSLGAGQTFLEGIADYDTEGRFGVPQTDMGIMKWEAENFNRPDYYGTLFNPDGVYRERMRLKRGLSIAGSHPVWFAGVMTRRAASMLRLERARLISTEPPVSHSLDVAAEAAPAWQNSAAELQAASTLAPQAKATVLQDIQVMYLTGDDSKYADQLVSAPFELQKNTDYVLLLPVRMLRGRMSIVVRSANTTHASVIVETEEMTPPEQQPDRLIQLPFVAGSQESARLVIANAASREANSFIQLGTARLYALGAASNTWTRAPRLFVNALQKLFITAVMLPLALFGLILLLRARAYRTLVILLVVPAYYLSIQSATHTEYRYVLSLHYFLFALAAVFIYMSGKYLRRKLTGIDKRRAIALYL
ncbi:MAG: glycosyltransferase family 39 protein [Pyrinomonadaceae bacterium]|nr:glycosyltransferase family 39 protein [Pyrinomonadaceae bacterium]